MLTEFIRAHTQAACPSFLCVETRAGERRRRRGWCLLRSHPIWLWDAARPGMCKAFPSCRRRPDPPEHPRAIARVPSQIRETWPLHQSWAEFLPLQHVYLSIHAPLSMVLLDIELELTSLWSPVLPSHPQTHFKKSVTFVAFHDFYKGNLSNKLHSTVSSSAIPYLSCFTACGWMPSGLGDLLLFILLYFFFPYKPSSTCTWIWNYFSHLLTEKGEPLLGSSTESTDAKILFNFSDLSQMLHFHLAHQLAQWMFWQISSLWSVQKNLSASFYNFSMKTCPMTLHLA